MISVLDSVDCSEVLVEVDPWIPMKVTWITPRTGQLLYLRVSGEDGGEVELKIDSMTGALLQAVVIDAPPGSGGFDSLPDAAHSGGRVPVLDRSVWDRKQTPDYSEPAHSVAWRKSSLRMVRQNSVITLAISSQVAVRYVGCDSVRVGVAADGGLVNIVALDR